MNGNNFFSTNYNRILGTAALVALVVALVAYAQYTFKQTEYSFTGPTMISVSGTAEILATPDIGQFSFSVMAEGDSARAAQEASAQKINDIIAYLKEEAVEDKDIKVEQYNLYPRYTYEARPCAFGQYCPPGEQVQDGFEVSQSVRVKVRDLDQTGSLLSGVGDRGATNISGLELTIDDTETIKTEAREQAIADAKAKAEVLAQNLGVRLVKMTSYYEDEGMYPPMPIYGRGGDMMEQSAVKVTPDIPVGENTISSRVTLTYLVR